MRSRGLRTKAFCLPKVSIVLFMHDVVLFILLQLHLLTAVYSHIRSPSIYVLTASSERDQHVSRGNVPLNTRALQGPGKSWLSFQGQTKMIVIEVNKFFLRFSTLKCTVGSTLLAWHNLLCKKEMKKYAGESFPTKRSL